MSLDPSIKVNLKIHLLNNQNVVKGPLLELGNLEKLKPVVKILSNEIVQNLQQGQIPSVYPTLPQRQCIALCVKKSAENIVYAIYTIEQIKRLQEQVHAGKIAALDWKILEISQEIENQLLKEITFQPQTNRRVFAKL